MFVTYKCHQPLGNGMNFWIWKPQTTKKNESLKCRCRTCKTKVCTDMCKVNLELEQQLVKVQRLVIIIVSLPLHKSNSGILPIAKCKMKCSSQKKQSVHESRLVKSNNPEISYSTVCLENHLNL